MKEHPELQRMPIIVYTGKELSRERGHRSCVSWPIRSS